MSPSTGKGLEQNLKMAAKSMAIMANLNKLLFCKLIQLLSKDFSSLVVHYQTYSTCCLSSIK
jgi:hypothetical protein